MCIPFGSFLKVDWVGLRVAARPSNVVPMNNNEATMVNCWRCDGEGEIPTWPHHLCTPAELAAGLNRQTKPCSACNGTGYNCPENETERK